MKRLALSLFFIAAAASTQAQEVELVFEVNDPEARTATFTNCKNAEDLTELAIPETAIIDGVEYTVTCIDFDAMTHGFASQRKLAYVTVPKTVTSIERLGIFGVDSDSVRIEFAEGSALRGIGPYAFSGNTGLRSLSLPATVGFIGEYAFSGCYILQHISIPAGVTTLQDGLFYLCRELSSVELPEGLEYIGEHAFCDCTSLKSLHLPASLAGMGQTSFVHCTGLKEVTVAEGNARYASEGGVLYTAAMDTLLLYPGARPDTMYVMPATVSVVDGDAFTAYIVANNGSLKRFYALSATPPEAWFTSVLGPATALYVRQSALEAYRTDDAWGTSFNDIVGISDEEADAIITDIDGVKADGDGVAGPANGHDGWRTLGGVSVDKPSKGIYIHNGKKVVVN